MAEKRLPEANEFSPGVVSLKRVLELIAAIKGDRARAIDALRQEYFANAAPNQTGAKKRKSQDTLASNVLIGLKGYGLIEDNMDRPVLTPMGQMLLDEPDDDERSAILGRHILVERHGLEVLDAIRSLRTRRIGVNKATLQKELESRGFKLPRATTYHTKLLQWLREAKVLPPRGGDYEIDEDRVAELIGVESETLAEWKALTRPQQAFLQALRHQAEVHGAAEQPGKAIAELAETQTPGVFAGIEDKLSARVYRPLEEKGWLVLSSRAEGKSGNCAPTPKLLALDLAFVGITGEFGIPPDLRSKLDTPLEEIYRNLSPSATDHERGIALELLALNMAIDLGLTPVGFRVRGVQTGGAEVDLIAEGAHLHFSRWSFQCKAVKKTEVVPLSALAKEIGMAVLLRGHVIVMVTTGTFSKTVEQHAEHAAHTTPLQVVLVDGAALAAYRSGSGPSLRDHFKKAAAGAMRLKRPQVLETLGEESATVAVNSTRATAQEV